MLTILKYGILMFMVTFMNPVFVVFYIILICTPSRILKRRVTW
jgi:hypothetical protein